MVTACQPIGTARHRAASLLGTGPVYGTDASQFMGWFYYGGGDALYRELI